MECSVRGAEQRVQPPGFDACFKMLVLTVPFKTAALRDLKGE